MVIWNTFWVELGGVLSEVAERAFLGEVQKYSIGTA